MKRNLKGSGETFVPIIALAVILLLGSIPAAHASVSGPYDLWYQIGVEGSSTVNADQMYPGGTVYLEYCFYNTQTSGSVTITQIGLTTPWQTYSDSSVPVTIDQGYAYCESFTVVIPSNEALGTGTWTFTNTATGFTPASSSFSVTIFANPATLQTQINTLNSEISSLQSSVSSLQSQLTAAQNNATSLQKSVTSLQSQVSSLQSQLTAAQNNATNLQKSVDSLKSQLSTSQAQLATTQSQLSNATATVNSLTTQLQSAQLQISNKTAQITTLSSQLSTTKASLATANANLAFSQGEVATYSSFYLPVGVAVPSIVAILFLVLYLRKGSRPRAMAAGTPPLQPAPAVASSAAAVSGSKFCPDCGTENRAIAKFCAKCGATLS